MQSTIMKRRMKIQMARVSNSREIPSPRRRGALNYGETRGGLGILQGSYPTHVLHNAGICGP